jgi:hypothetical protein
MCILDVVDIDVAYVYIAVPRLSLTTLFLYSLALMDSNPRKTTRHSLAVPPPRP